MPLASCGSWLMANSLATLAAVLRTGFGVNKYVLWVGLTGVLQFGREYYMLSEGDGKSVALRVGVLVCLTGVLLRIGIKKMDKYKTIGKPTGKPMAAPSKGAGKGGHTNVQREWA